MHSYIHMFHLFLLRDGESMRGVACGFLDIPLLPLEGDDKVNNRLSAAELEQERRRQQIQRLSHRLSFAVFVFVSFTSRLYSKMSSSSFLFCISVVLSVVNSGAFIKILLHNHSVIYKILIFFFRRSKIQRIFPLFYFASQES